VKLIVEADGGSRGNPGIAGFGAVVREAATGQVLAERAAYLGDSVTNNVAEYSGLIAGLQAAIGIDPAARLDIRMDSKLVVSQMSGAWKVKNADLAKLVAEARGLIAGREVTFTWVPRERNQAADALANEAMDTGGTVQRLGSEQTASYIDLDNAVRLAQATGSGTQRHPGVGGVITTVILIRHGMSTDTDRDVFAGGVAPGPPLSAAGRCQAEAAAAELTRMTEVPWFGLGQPTVLLSSPTRRTLQTAQALSGALSLEVGIDEGFAEEGFGLWDGLTKSQVEARWPNAVAEWARDPSYVPEGGESRDQVGVRVKAALERVARSYTGQAIVIVSHAMATRAAIGAALGAPATAWFGFRIAPASINVLRLWDLGYTEVVCTNRTVVPVK
jgi:probable phosphoglycerate mutase